MRIVLEPKIRQRMQTQLGKKISRVSIHAHHTICDHLRLLYQTLLVDLQKELCEEIIYLAKRMAKKLEENAKERINNDKHNSEN